MSDISDQKQKRPQVAVRCLDDENGEASSGLSDSAPTPVSGQWPTEPQPLTKDQYYDWLSTAYDIFLCAIPVFLAVKTTLCIVAEHLDKSHRGYSIDQLTPLTGFLIKFNEQLVTAYTIVFVTIMSTAVRRFALYKAQEGAYITDLEQLQASISLPSTIKMVISLRKFTKFSLALVAAWSFYYLGSQASKREYAYVLSNRAHEIQAAYPTDGVGSYFDSVNSTGDNDLADDLPSLNQEIVAAWNYLYSDFNIAGTDNSGYMVIPDLCRTYECNNDSQAKWHKIVPSETHYTSFAGRPVVLKTTTKDENQTDEYWDAERMVGEYTLRSTYLDVHCGSYELLPADSFPKNVTEGMFTSLNKTGLNQNITGVVSFDLWGRWNASYYPWQYDGGPTFSALGQDSGSIKVACNLSNVYVELHTRCSEAACLANRVRQLPANVTALLHTPFGDDYRTASFFSNILLSAGYPSSDSSDDGTSAEENFGTGELLSALANNASDTEGIGAALNDTSLALMQNFNTYYNLAMYGIPYDKPNASIGFDLLTFHGALYDPHYAINWAWIAMDYLSCLILFAAAVFAFWLRTHTLAPDIFGYVSSLTRPNPDLPIDAGGSALSGVARTRQLKDVKIRIGDVNEGDEEVGRIGITVASESRGIKPLMKEKRYL